MDEIILRSIPTIEELSSIDVSHARKTEVLIYDTEEYDLVKRGVLLLCNIHPGGIVEWRLDFPNGDERSVHSPQDVGNYIPDMILSHGNSLESMFGYFPKRIIAIDAARVTINDNTHIDFVGWREEPMGAYAVKYTRASTLSPGTISCPPGKYEPMMCILNKSIFGIYRPDIITNAQRKEVWKYIHTSDQSPDVFRLYDTFLGMVDDKRKHYEYMMRDEYTDSDNDDVSSSSDEQNPSDKS